MHLYSQGYTDADLVDFSLELTNPSTIYEQEKVELWSNKISLADSIKDNKMLSENWIYEHIFGLSIDDVEKQRANVIEDTKQIFRRESIENGEGDPANPPKEVEPELEEPQQQEETKTSEEYGAMGGQTKDVPSYGKSQDSARGRDPLGKETRSIHRESFIKTLNHFSAKLKSEKDLLSENNIMDDNSL